MANEAVNQAAQRGRRRRRAPHCQAAEAGAALRRDQAAQLALGNDGAPDAAGAAAHAATGGVIDPFVFRLAIFVLAIFVGYYVVWSVTPALHTPLMCGHQRHLLGHRGRRAAGRRRRRGRLRARRSRRLFGFVALMLASVNIFGGFLVTQRMLAHVQEEGLSRRPMSANLVRLPLPRRRRPVHPGAARAVASRPRAGRATCYGMVGMGIAIADHAGLRPPPADLRLAAR